MSNEITTSVTLSLANGKLKDSRIANNIKTDQTTALSAAGVQPIGTTEEAVTVGDVSTPRECYIRNLDATNFVEIGLKPASTFYPFCKLAVDSPPMLITISDSTTLYAKADTATVNIDKLIVDE